MRAPILFLPLMVACRTLQWPAPPLPTVASDPDRGAIIGAIVRWSDGQALSADPQSAHLEIQSIDSPGAAVQPVLDSNGAYAALHLPPGHYRIAARALGYLPVDTACQVSAGQVDTVILMPDPAVAGTVRVRPAHDRYARVRPVGGPC